MVLVVHQWKHQSLDRQSKLVQSVQVVFQVVVVEVVRYLVVSVQVEVQVEFILERV